MKNTKTKIILILGLIIVIAIIATLTIMFIIPIKGTKSDQEELWDYVFNNNIPSTLQSYFEGEDYDEILKDKLYQTTTNISFECDMPEKKNLAEHLQRLEINVTSKTDNKDKKQAMGSIVLSYLKNQLFKLDYIKDNESFGIKSDELVDKYLGIKNENLDILAKNFNINSDIKKIQFVDYKALLPTSQTINKIEENVKSAISEQIGTEKFEKQTKRKSEVLGNKMSVESYTIVLDDEATYKALEKILERLTEDQELVKELNEKNKTLKLLGIKNEISEEKIKDYIQTIKNKSFSHKQLVMATIYVADKKMIKFDINITNEDGKSKQYIVECIDGSNTIKLTINKQEGENLNTKEIELKTEGDEQNREYSISINNIENNKQQNSIVIKTRKPEGSLDDGDVIDKIIVELRNESDYIKINIKNEIKIVDKIDIQSLTSSNCLFVNDMEAENLKSKLNLIAKGIENLYETKKNIIISGKLEELTKPVNNTVKQHNAKFDIYEGEFTGTIVAELLNKIIDSNTNSEYKIALKTKLTEDDETELKNTEVIFDKVQPLANLLDRNASYIISIHYQQVSGAIDEISIVKSGLEKPEPPEQVVIPQENNENQQQDTNQQ